MVARLLGHREDFGNHQLYGGVGVETVTAVEIGGIAVVGEVFILAVHDGVLCAEEG